MWGKPESWNCTGIYLAGSSPQETRALPSSQNLTQRVEPTYKNKVGSH